MNCRAIVGVFIGLAASNVLAQERGQTIVMECGQLSPGFDMGHDDSEHRHDWLELVKDFPQSMAE